MAEFEELTISSFLGLFNLRSVYLLGYAWLFGMCELLLYHNGVLFTDTLPRPRSLLGHLLRWYVILWRIIIGGADTLRGVIAFKALRTSQWITQNPQIP